MKARKGFHTDVARWAERQGFDTLFVDGQLVSVSHFRKLERFKEHTIDVVVGVIDRNESRRRGIWRSARWRLAVARRICSTRRINSPC